MKYLIIALSTYCLGQGLGHIQNFTDFERFAGSILLSFLVCSLTYFDSKDRK